MALIESLTGSGIPGQAALQIVGVPQSITTAGTSQGTATLISTAFALLTTAASQTGAILPSSASGSQVGDEVVCWCLTSTSAVVYPAGSETINNASSITVAQYKMLFLKRVSTTAWGAIITA